MKKIQLSAVRGRQSPLFESTARQTHSDAPTRSRPSRNLPSLLVLLFGTALSVLLFFSLWAQERRMVIQAFEATALDRADVIRAGFERRLIATEATAAFFIAAPNASAGQFHSFAQPLVQSFPAMRALFWVDASAGREGLNLPITFIEPSAPNRNAIGFDLAANTPPGQLLRAARDSGQTVATRSQTLPFADPRHPALVLFQPAYREPAATTSERREQFIGFAGAVFRVREVVENALEPLRPGGVDIALFDEGETGTRRLLYFHPSRTRPDFPALQSSQDVRHAIPAPLELRVPFSLAGRSWTVALTAAPNHFGTTPDWEAWTTLLVALLITVILAQYLSYIRRHGDVLKEANVSLSREIHERQALEEALFEEKERAEVTLNAIGDAVISVDPQGRVGFLNPAAEKLTGVPLSQAVERPLNEVFALIDEDTRTRLPDPVDQAAREGRPVVLAAGSVLQSQTGAEYAIQAIAAPIRGSRQEMLGVVITFRDVTRARRMVRRIAHRAAHDPLTGLVNRREFERRLEKALLSSRRYGTAHALCYIDLDHFKEVNDAAGHQAGDELLKRITSLMAADIRERDTLARLGGDEFALLLDNCPLEKAHDIAQKLIDAVRNLRFVWAGRRFEVGASIGLVALSGDVTEAAELLREADAACYTAKALGRNQVHIYRTQERAVGGISATQAQTRAAFIRQALDEERFQLYGQPIVALNGSPTNRFELLLRLPDPAGHILLPRAFLPAAERDGLSALLDRWVIHTTARRYGELASRLPGLELNVNLAGASLGDGSLLDGVHGELRQAGIAPERICFEIAEATAIHNLNATRRFVREAERLGYRTALDRFGGGLASLGYLRRLPVDFLKIDGRYVQGADRNTLDAAVVSAFNQLGHAVGMRTIGVLAETPAIVDKLREFGVDFAQGFALAPPLPLSELGGQV